MCQAIVGVTQKALEFQPIHSIHAGDCRQACHHGTLRERHCDNEKCIVSFEVYNTWLYRLKLEPITRFRVEVGVSSMAEIEALAVEVTDGTVHDIEIIRVTPGISYNVIGWNEGEISESA